jgi:hypothetical protein
MTMSFFGDSHQAKDTAAVATVWEVLAAWAISSNSNKAVSAVFKDLVLWVKD